MTNRVFHVGDSVAVRTALGELFATEPATDFGAGLAAGDVVVVEAFANHGERSDVAGRNAYSACQVWKQQPGVAVHIVVMHDDPIGVQLARFVLADGVLTLGAEGALHGLEQLRTDSVAPRRRLIDSLLERFGSDAAGDDREPEALQRMLEFEGEENFLHRLQDEETGLFAAPYAALKLDEEFKRSRRFHLPLSLILLDIGPAAAELPAGAERRAVLAEVASVFLNECRDIDVLGRFTDTVFLFLLPGTPSAGAATVATRMLAELGEREFSVELTPVAGVAAVPDPGIGDRKEMLIVAENCLRRAAAADGGSRLVTAWE